MWLLVISSQQTVLAEFKPENTIKINQFPSGTILRVVSTLEPPEAFKGWAPIKEYFWFTVGVNEQEEFIVHYITGYRESQLVSERLLKHRLLNLEPLLSNEYFRVTEFLKYIFNDRRNQETSGDQELDEIVIDKIEIMKGQERLPEGEERDQES